MPKKNIKNSFVLPLFLLVIIGLHYGKILTPLENLISRGLSYPLAWIYSATQHATDPFNNVNSLHGVVEENVNLKNKIIKLENDIIRLQEILGEKEILDNQIEFLSKKNINYVSAKIITRGINQNQNLLTINRGSKDNLEKGMAVVIENGLVIGKLQNVMPEVSYLLLLTDSRSEISASSLKNNSLVGIIKGKTDLSLELEFIPKEKNLEIGDTIITSGVEEKIPSGLFIGDITDISQDKRDLFNKATVWQPADIKNITIINVVLK